MKKRIFISVTSDLSTDQRVLKVAQTCHQNDYEVVLIGRKLSSSTHLELPFRYKRFKLLFNSSFLFYAEFNIRLFFFLLFRKMDLLISNDTDTLAANFLVSKIRNKALIFDAHELFPEVPELQNRAFVKNIWTKMEDIIFPKLKYCYTVCNSIADYYNRKYKLNMQVVRNVPYFKTESKKLLNYGENKIILYQGALNVGRGLEWVIDAMPLIQHAVLVIIGDGDIKSELERKVLEKNLSAKVKFLGKISGNELYRYTSSADIGLCLLENKGLSYYYSLPNRIFDLIQAHVPILASNFPEIASIVKQHNTGCVIDHYEPEYLSEIITEMLNNPMQTDHFSELSKEFCWENEEKVLIELLKTALSENN